MWSTTASHAKHLASLPPAEFASAVDRALHAPPVTPSASAHLPSTYPLPQSLRELMSAAAAVVEKAVPGPRLLTPPRVVDAPGPKGAFPLQLSHALRCALPPSPTTP